jgi:excisionase family DNA binding protein
MTLKVAQEYTGIGESKLKQLIFAKELPNSSPDTTIRIMRKDLDALMERCRR